MADSDLQIGDVVELKSGSHPMTVDYIHANGTATVILFDDKEQVVKSFNVRLLSLKPYQRPGAGDS